MTEPRIEIVTPCEHGYDLAHAGLSDRSEAIKRGVPDCPGGSRLVYTREEAVPLIAAAIAGDRAACSSVTSSADAAAAVDALLGLGIDAENPSFNRETGVTDQMVERAAAHILAQVNGDDPGTERWDKLDQTYGELAEEIREQYRGMAQAALEADQ